MPESAPAMAIMSRPKSGPLPAGCAWPLATLFWRARRPEEDGSEYRELEWEGSPPPLLRPVEQEWSEEVPWGPEADTWLLGACSRGNALKKGATH